MSGRAPRASEPVCFALRETEPEDGRLIVYHRSGDARWIVGDAVELRR
jgi:hypothetical protein